MKLKDIITENSWTDPQLSDKSELDYDEQEEDMLSSMATDFADNKTCIKEFDKDKIKRILRAVLGQNPELRDQADKMLTTWNDDFDENCYVDNNVFNTLFKQYEQLVNTGKGGSNDTPLIKFNKLHSFTKELGDNISRFDDYKDSNDAFEFKHNYYNSN